MYIRNHGSITKKIPAHISLNYEFIYVIKRKTNIYISPIRSEYINVSYKPYKQNQYINIESSLQMGGTAGIYIKLEY